jgi:hypothetical protein
LLRKISSQALRQKCVIFYHDPQCQISDHAGRVYESIGAWVADTAPARLSIFRGVDAESVAELALAARDVTLVLDEMDEAFSNKRFHAGPDKSAIRRVIHYGRHHRVSLMGGFRRTANVSEDVLSQCDRVFLFRGTTACPSDTEALLKRFGKPTAQLVQQLKFGQFTMWMDAA